MTSLKDQCFGVEVEMTGITRKQAAQALADYFGTVPKAKGGVYDTWKVKDPTGKEWKLVSDASIIGEQWTGTEYLENDIKDFRVELVTPKLTYPELPKLQECMRRLKQIGAKVNDSCGIHVHVDAANHNRQSLKNLISIMYSKEDIQNAEWLTVRSKGTKVQWIYNEKAFNQQCPYKRIFIKDIYYRHLQQTDMILIFLPISISPKRLETMYLFLSMRLISPTHGLM